MRQIEWAETGIWLKADTHIHTRFSDGKYELGEVVARAKDNGCDVIAISDHADRQAATPEYFEAIRIARETHPEVIILAAMEWNVPPWGGDEHATVLVEPSVEQGLMKFKELFDDHGRDVHDESRAFSGLRWLAENASVQGVSPVVIYNHPSRKDEQSLENVEDLTKWRVINDVVVGFSGAPGHQAAETLGEYAYTEKPLDRWDPAAGRVGDAWDTLLSRGIDVWAARAPSDFHSEKWDFWPGQFSETWLYVPERTTSGVLRAFRAGSFFAVHGQIAREVQLSVHTQGLPRPAMAGESLSVPAGAELIVELSCRIPDRDWAEQPNRLDQIELIAVTDSGAKVLAEREPATSGPALRETIQVPQGGVVLRARGRRIVAEGPDLLFYTNPVRIVTP